MLLRVSSRKKCWQPCMPFVWAGAVSVCKRKWELLALSPIIASTCIAWTIFILSPQSACITLHHYLTQFLFCFVVVYPSWKQESALGCFFLLCCPWGPLHVFALCIVLAAVFCEAVRTGKGYCLVVFKLESFYYCWHTPLYSIYNI